MTPASRRFIFIAGCALVATGAVAIWWHARARSGASPSPASPSSASTTSHAGGLALDLPTILKEPNEILRLHLLANWVHAHETSDIVTASQHIDGENRARLQWLLSAKLAELNPGETPEQINARLRALLETVAPADESPDSRTSPRDQILALARTDAPAALGRLAALRIHPGERENLICTILGQTAATDPQRALQLLEGRTDVNHRDALKAIAAAWTQKDPAAALAWTLSLPASAHRDDLTDRVLQSWANKDPGAALEAATAAGGLSSPNHNGTIKTLLARWLKQAPDESAAWLRQQQNPPVVVVQAAIEALSGSHPLLAADLLAQHLPYSQQQAQTRPLIEGWIEKDPAGCLAWIRNRPADTIFFDAARFAATRLARKDPAAAITFVNSLPRDAYLGYLIDETAGSMASPETALTWLLGLPAESTRNGTLVDVFRRMDFAQPRDALALLSRMPDGPSQNAVYVAVAQDWLDKDPKGAVAWLGSLQNPSTQLAVIQAIGYDWSQADPQGAAAFAKRLGSGPAYEELVPQAARAWAAKDPSAAASWLMGLPDTDASRQATGTVFEHLARYRPDAVASLIQRLPATDSRHEAAVYWTMVSLNKTTPADGARLLTTLGTPAEQQKLAHRMTYDWGPKDLPAATNWTNTLPPGAMRDEALTGLVFATAKKDPRAALALAASATSPVQRDNIIASAISEWQRSDAPAALAALENSPLPEERKQKLRKLLTSH